MSKIKLNATCADLTSTLKLDEIKMLQQINSPALTIRDKDGNCIFKLMAAGYDSVTADACTFSQKDMEGYAVMSFPIDTTKDRNEIYEDLYRRIGAVKGYLDQIEPVAVAAVQTESERKAAFIAELGGTQTETAAAE